MKKTFLFTALSAILALGFEACSENDPTPVPDVPERPENPANPSTPQPPATETTSIGAFFVNSGAQYANLPGSLSYLDYNTNAMNQSVFYNNNGQYVGDTFNDGCVLGDKIYLAVTDSRVIHVIDRESFVLLNTIQPSTTAGPRHITSYDGMIYFTLFGSPGYLCRLNPTTMDYDMIEVGPQPEYVVAFNDMLYVAVSDGYSTTFSNSCIAVVNPATFKVEQTITGIKNPVQLATNGTQLFVASWGEYDESYQQVNYGIHEIVDNEISETTYVGNYMAIKDNQLYYVNAGWDVYPVTYSVLDTQTGVSSEWISSDKGVYAPTGIGVDPVTGDVFVMSNEEGAYGYPSYTTPGFVFRFSADGSLIDQYPLGVGPTSMFFNVEEAPSI